MGWLKTKLDFEKHNKQCREIVMVQLPQAVHDRFLIIDEEVWLLGSSVKDMGHSLCSIIKMSITPDQVLSLLKQIEFRSELHKGNIRNLLHGLAALYLLNLYLRDDHKDKISIKDRNEIDASFGASLFAVKVHTPNSYRTDNATTELSVAKNAIVDPPVSVVAKFATTASDGKIYNTEHFSLDMILSVGYRVHSPQGILFRTWANSVLKHHLLHGYSVNHQLVALQQHVDDRLLRIEDRLQQNEKQVAFLVRTHQQPTYQLYDNGCVFDAWAYVSDLVRNATQRIILIDNYVDDRVLSIMQKRTDGVSCTIHTRYTEQFKTDLEKHNEQYPAIQYVQLPQRKHDRYLIVDDVVYMLGGSLKDMGKSLCGIIRTEMQPEEILTKLK